MLIFIGIFSTFMLMETQQKTETIVQKTSKWPKRLLIVFFVILISFVIYVFICGFSYSEGSRTGVAVKISNNGYFFKTYEGTLNLGGISTENSALSPIKIWDFSVQKNDTTVFNKITNTQGKEVRLYYKEVIKTFFWQGDSRFYVYKVEIIK